MSRLDYCNSVLAGLPLATIAPLQRVQNAAARLIFEPPSVALATGPFAGPVQVVLSHALSFLREVPGPLAIANVVSPVDCGCPRRDIRSSSSSDFSLLWLRTKFSECAFTYAGLCAWNSLPKDLRAVTDPGLIENDSRHTFLVWLSVFADNSDDSVMHL